VRREQEEQEVARAGEENGAVGNGRTEEQGALHMELGGQVAGRLGRAAPARHSAGRMEEGGPRPAVSSN
jgi:hypothetical protein